MESAGMIIWAGIALPSGADEVQTRFAVHVAGNRITETGPVDQLRARYPEAAVEGDARFCMLPGLTNSHDHGGGLGTFPLGTDDDLLEVWLPGLYARPTVDPYLLAAWEGVRQLRAGVTLAAHSHSPRDWGNMESEAAATLRGYGDAGLRVAFHPPMVDQNPLIYADRDAFLAQLPATLHATAHQFLQPTPLTHNEYFELCGRLYNTYHDSLDHRVHIQISPAGGQWCSDELMAAAADFAHQHGTRLQMHMLETRYQQIYAYRMWGTSFIQHLAEIGVLGPWLTLAHMIWIDVDDLQILHAHCPGIAHNPSSNLRLRSGVAPLSAYLANDIPIGIGMDGQTLDDDQDILRELRLAYTLANRPGAHAPSVTAGEILTMGLTHGATVTLGSDAPLGRLVPDALADLVLIDWEAVSDPWVAPHLSPAAVLLRKASRHHIRHVMANGEWVIRDGRAAKVDEAELAAAICEELAGHDPADLSLRAQTAAELAPYLRRFYAAWDAPPPIVQPYF